MSDLKLMHQLFAAHAKQVRGFFRRRVAERNDVPDLSQEVFLRLLRLQNLDSIEDPQRYLFTVASNLLYERAHSQAQRARPTRVPIEEVLDAPELAAEMSADQELDTEKQVLQLRRILQSLPAREREALVLVYEERQSYREIARRWGVSRTAVEKVVSRATARCRQYMNAAGAL